MSDIEPPAWAGAENSCWLRPAARNAATKRRLVVGATALAVACVAAAAVGGGLYAANSVDPNGAKSDYAVSRDAHAAQGYCERGSSHDYRARF